MQHRPMDVRTRRRQVLVLVGTSLATCGSAFAQKKIPRIGMLSLDSGETLEPVREGLRALGYVDGKNIRLEERAAEDHYDKLAAIAREFVSLNVDVIITSGTTATTAAQRTTSTIPIVMIAGIDPVKAGFAASLAHPGGNVTGVATNIQESTVKRFELAKEIVPALSRVGIFVNPESRTSSASLVEAEAAVKHLRLTPHIIEIGAAGQFAAAFDALARASAQALVTLPSSMFSANKHVVIPLAAKFRLPAVYPSMSWVDAGGLASYSANSVKARRDAAIYVDRILRGAKPGELPIEQPNRLELGLNLKTARALGLKIPDVLLLRAEKVIR